MPFLTDVLLPLPFCPLEPPYEVKILDFNILFMQIFPPGLSNAI